MENLILGLLMLSPMTGYELQQFIKKHLALICSHSAGSVQTALSKLVREGKVTSSKTSQGKRLKKVFSITDMGRTAFSSWVAHPMQAGKIKNMELSRLFFCEVGQAGGTPLCHSRLYSPDGRYQISAFRYSGLFLWYEQARTAGEDRLGTSSAISGIYHRLWHCRCGI